MEYLDFELSIGVGTQGEYPVSVARSPMGAAAASMRLPFDEEGLRGRLQDVEMAVLRSSTVRRDIVMTQSGASPVASFGGELWSSLMTGVIRDNFRQAQRQARAEGKGLRLRLRVDDAALAALPWEFLYDPDAGDYVCLSTTTPLVRYLELPYPPSKIVVKPPLSILAMVSSPTDRPPLDVEHEKKRMEEATAALQAAGLLRITWLERATARELGRALRNGTFHVFHFVGHGGFDPSVNEGVLAFMSEEDGKTALMQATEVARFLVGHQTLQMVVLNSCLGAKGSGSNVFSSTAAVLARREVPAVVAMQYEISDMAAIEFSRTLYEAIADGMPIDAAVSEARKQVSVVTRQSVEWGTPVLHMRAPDGVLFQIDGLTTSQARATGRFKRQDRASFERLAAEQAAAQAVSGGVAMQTPPSAMAGVAMETPPGSMPGVGVGSQTPPHGSGTGGGAPGGGLAQGQSFAPAGGASAGGGSGQLPPTGIASLGQLPSPPPSADRGANGGAAHMARANRSVAQWVVMGVLALALLGGGAWVLLRWLDRPVIVDHAQFEEGLATRAFFPRDTIVTSIELFDDADVVLEPGADGFIAGVVHVSVASSDTSVVVAEALDSAGTFRLLALAPGTATISARVFMDRGLQRDADPMPVVVKRREDEFRDALDMADDADAFAKDSTAADSVVLAQYRLVLARYGPVLLEDRPTLHQELTAKVARFEELQSLRVRADSALGDSVSQPIAPRFVAVNAYHKLAGDLRPNGSPDRNAIAGWVAALDTLTYARLSRASICRGATSNCGANTRPESLPLNQNVRANIGVVLGNDRRVNGVEFRWLHGGEVHKRKGYTAGWNAAGYGLFDDKQLDREGMWTLEVVNGRGQRVLVHRIEVQ